ncbi:MAG: M15 family metallopeptidase [Patescibacteria group bacterium]
MRLGFKKEHLVLMGAVVVIAMGLIYLGYSGWELSERNKLLKERVSGLELALNIKDKNLAVLRGDKAQLSGALQEEKTKTTILGNQVQGLSGAVGELTGTVGVLQKLQRTDKELLQKYSKVYFLSEHYAPEQVVEVPTKYLMKKDRPEELFANVFPYFEKMLVAAEKDGIGLELVSGYRSFGEQAIVKQGYKVVFGSGANQFSADQGYSEHQLGTTVDFTTPEIKAIFDGFEETKAYKWLQDNAHKYGFVLSYPPNNAYYQFEPWHWRFVGVALATKLHDEGKFFYDLPQRDIDEFLINIFD